MTVRSCLTTLATLSICALSSGVRAATPPTAYQQVAATVGLQPAVLYAVAGAESTRPHYPHPWPWTANIRGQGHYYPTRQALYQALRRELANGNDDFDVGLMQISWHYHARWFATLWQATDPRTNLTAGARHLRTLVSRSGHLDTAIALYHVGSLSTASRIRRGQHYLARVHQQMEMGTAQ